MLALLVNLPKETLTSQLGFGAVLMLLGMATVFLFLVVLIFCTKAMSSIIGKRAKNVPAEAKKPATANVITLVTVKLQQMHLLRQLLPQMMQQSQQQSQLHMTNPITRARG